MKKAIGYLRVSTVEQAESGLGIADQQARIEAYCKLRRLELVRTVTDNGCSGGKPLAMRPGGKKMLAALRRREANAVVILKLDRGFRNAADCLATVEDWERKGITLHIVDLGGNAIDTASAAGKFMLTVLAGAAEMERNLARERTRAAMDVMRQRGERISRYAPFGWSINSQGELEPDAAEQKALARIRELHPTSKSLRQIAAELAAEGMLGRNGTPLSAKTIRAILKRPVRAT
jgi:site-specific DNA recombinase